MQASTPTLCVDLALGPDRRQRPVRPGFEALAGRRAARTTLALLTLKPDIRHGRLVTPVDLYRGPGVAQVGR